MSAGPQVLVCCGGGGVGKTTTSAAIAMALARRGARALIVTIDPARRLAGALGAEVSDQVTKIPMPAGPGGLWALMPDPRRSMRALIEHLFAEDEAALRRVLANPLYIGLSDAAAGVHELVAMNLVAQAAAQGAFDVLVIDTAPSRHAIDFVTYPGRLAALLGGRTVSFLAGLAQRSAPPHPGPGARRGWLERATGQVDQLLSRVTGPNLVRDTAALFSDLALVRERFVDVTRRAAELLLGERVRYALIAAPTAAARDDVLFLAARLQRLGRRPGALVLNRAAAGPWLEALRRAQVALPPALSEAVGALSEEYASRARAAAACAQDLGRHLPRTPILHLPHIEAAAPEVIVSALAQELERELPLLLPARA